MSWTDDRVELLRKLWGEGHTAAEIAKKLGEVTRNAVIGKAHRLKLPSRVSPIQAAKKKSAKPANSNVNAAKAKVKPSPVAITPKQTRKTVLKSAKVPPTVSAHNTPTGALIPLVDLKAGQCRWPSGDPRKEQFGFCGEPSMEGLPYCTNHATMAYQAATRNRILKTAGGSAKKSAIGSSQKKATK